MSNSYAIAGVTAVLQGIIDQGLVDHGISAAIGIDTSVSALSPDRVALDLGLNLFFYQATPNLGLRNECLPSRNARSDRLTNQPLALDLHYLISANGDSDLFSEMLLGSAMQTLHEKPFFDRNEVRNLLTPPPLPDVDPVLNALEASGLVDQFEQVRVTPEYLSIEDMSKLWSAIQSNYRPSAAYVATVVLIQAERSAHSPLPVLTREINARPTLIPPTPTLLDLEYPNHKTVVHLGETVTITGYHLNGPIVRAQLLMRSEDLVADFPILVGASDEQVEFIMPVDAVLWRAGVYQLSLTMDDVNGNPVESNKLSLTVAPEFSNFTAIRNADTTVSVNVTVIPEIHENQSVSLILGQTEQIIESFTGPTGSADFEFPVIDAGNYWARIRVEGIDSVLIDRGVIPPAFVANQEVVVP